MKHQDGPARVNSLTGLRIIAAAAVFMSHVGAPTFAPPRLTAFIQSGYNGVTLFFVLSGFVLAWNYADRLLPLTGRALWSFGVARFARVYPMYLFALLWAAAPALVTHTLPDRWWHHVLAIQPWNKDVMFANALNGPGWSIGVEFFLYAFLPPLLLALGPLRRRPSMLLVMGLLVVALVGTLAWWFTVTGRGALNPVDPASAHRWLYRMPLTRLGDFALGIIAALLIRTVRLRQWIGAAAQTLAVLAFAALMAWPQMLNSAWSWDFAYLVPAAVLIWGLAAAPATLLARVLATKAMVLAGEASFAFYLLHFPLLARLGAGEVDRWYGWLFATSLTFAMIFLVAVGAHIVIERPAQRWIRSMLDRRPKTVLLEELPPIVPKNQVLI